MGPQTPGRTIYNPFTEVTLSNQFVGRKSALNQFHVALNGLELQTPSHRYVAGVHGTGKTSFLRRLTEIAQENTYLGVLATLDEGIVAPRQHIITILTALIESLDDFRNQRGDDLKLLQDWYNGTNSTRFRVPRGDTLSSDEIRKDCKSIQGYLKEPGIKGAVICIDEGQRILPSALSAMKNALQAVPCYLLVLSLRLNQVTTDQISDGRRMLDEKAQEAEGDYGASRFYS